MLKPQVRNGQYELLSTVLADQATAPSTNPAVRDDLEAAAMLTAFHTGHPASRSRLEPATASVNGRLTGGRA